jgi:UDP-N-acetylmuramoyl-tripeptide--D-alanyl-D-alanine ligase
MEFFKTLDAVAMEELSVSDYSKMALINKDDIDGQFAKYLKNANINTYGTSGSAEYHYISKDYTAKDGHVGMFIAPELQDPMPATIRVLGEHTLRPAIAAAAVGVKLGMDNSQLVRGLEKIRSLPGRMNKLRGANQTTIIDDSYNSSPLAAKSSLRTLYQLNVPRRIAVLGDMNELGATSAAEHEELGKMCDPNQLAWVITVGKESENYLAPAAKSRGCQVKSFHDALSAGAFVRSVIEPGGAILFKGSQGDIYLEEAVKMVLHDTADEAQLVRQTPEWTLVKNKFFSKFS